MCFDKNVFCCFDKNVVVGITSVHSSKKGWYGHISRSSQVHMQWFAYNKGAV